MTAEPVNNDNVWTVRRVLEWTIDYLKSRDCENPRLDAEILLAYARRCKRIQLYTDYDQPMTDQQREMMRSLVKRRAAAEPVAYLVGHREFFSSDFEITRDVFIPRPETETLVMAALEVIKPLSAPRLLELCTGSACIPVAIAKNHPGARIQTVEKFDATAEVASRNIKKHGLADRIALLRGDLFGPVGADDRFDVIVSNPPYIPSAEIEDLDATVREHEPRAALDGGDDGLDMIRILIQKAPDFLIPNGWLMFELSPEQAEKSMDLLTQRGFSQVAAKLDLSGNARVVLGCWPDN